MIPMSQSPSVDLVERSKYHQNTPTSSHKLSLPYHLLLSLSYRLPLRHLPHLCLNHSPHDQKALLSESVGYSKPPRTFLGYSASTTPKICQHMIPKNMSISRICAMKLFLRIARLSPIYQPRTPLPSTRTRIVALSASETGTGITVHRRLRRTLKS